LYYNICEIPVNATTTFLVDQHLSRDKHKNNLKLKETHLINTKQTLISNINVDNFYEDIFQAFISANIPLFKLQNLSLCDFLQKYTKRHIQDESTVRKNYMKKCYFETINSIRSSIRDHNIWTSIDETTDCEERYVANVMSVH